MIDQALGHYRIVGKLAGGGMGPMLSWENADGRMAILTAAAVAGTIAVRA